MRPPVILALLALFGAGAALRPAIEAAQDTTAAAPPPPAARRPRPQPAEAGLRTIRPTPVRSYPNGPSIGSLGTDVVVVPLARERGAVRVRVEGWVAENQLAPADSSFSGGLTAADLRADPQGTRGRVVRWRVEVFAMQTADPLRRDLGPDERYLLARGPDQENALLYLVVPPALHDAARAIRPLGRATITAVVRTGRSEPAGVPILELRTISAQ